MLTAIGPKSVNEQAELRFTVSGSDVDQPTQPLVYSATGLPTGATFDPTTHEFVWTPTEAQGPGSFIVTFSVTDGVVTVSEAVTMTVTEVNVAPVLTAVGPKTVAEGTLLSFTISATDADAPNQTLVYSATGLSAGAAFNAATRTFSWTPTEAQGPSTNNLTFSVTDGVVTTSEVVTITVTEVNVAPVLTAIGPKTVAEGTLLSFTISATDADAPTQALVYSATGLPAGAVFNAATRTFSWTPTEAQGPSTNNLTFSVTDGVVTTSEVVTITVTEVNQAPVLQPITSKTVNEGSLLTFTAAGSDADQPAQILTYSLASGAPSGAAIMATTGVFTWTPTDGPGAGPYSVTIQVTDGVATASQTFVITVLNVAPTATVTVPASAVAGVDLSFSGVIGDVGLSDTLQVSWNFGDGVTLPFLAAARGTVTTTHQYATAGTYSVTLTVKDSNGAQTSVSRSLSVVTVGLTTDPWDATKTALGINGTNNGDNITVAPSGTANYQVTINGQSTIIAKPTGRIIVHGWGGGDNITINSAITTPTILFGDAGGDNITGGAGPNVIFGGADASGDNLTGGAARDILIGGGGGDNLTGNGDDDLLIGGTTAYDTNLVAMCNLTAEWLRTDQTYSQRVSHLLNGGGLNGTFTLNVTTVFDDAVGDNLSGNAGTDWFFAKVALPGRDNASSVTGETVTTPGAPPAPLLAQGGARTDDGSLAALTSAQLAPIVQEAQARWVRTGLTLDQQTVLASLTWQIADLEGATLGLTNGTTVRLDATAAGYGWFLDVTPKDNAEFHFVRGLAQWIADGSSPAAGHMDLLTTVMHEMGHVLGYDDQQAQSHRATLMTEALPTGVRRSILTAFESGPSLAAPVPPSSDAGTAFWRRSLQAVAGAWGGGGTEPIPGASSTGSSAVAPVIDWREREGPQESHKKMALGFSVHKTSWLQRFLLDTGREEVAPHDHGIEVVLPGKKK
ncbi:hypothetical protein NITLEN_90147 [Nitrospira lenta]|uniref:PKD domain-containing protein n=1 Tax=Nitrospira lenta TaxID=1436998 RepID=A0A330L9Z7_9BACT|nr:hypothetical protein NITLEN_90147 [Nitrospira lenta]